MAEEELGIRGKKEPPKLTTPYITKTDSYTPGPAAHWHDLISFYFFASCLWAERESQLKVRTCFLSGAHWRLSGSSRCVHLLFSSSGHWCSARSPSTGSSGGDQHQNDHRWLLIWQSHPSQLGFFLFCFFCSWQEQKDTRQQRLEILSKIEKVQCGWICTTFTISSLLWFPNKMFCSSVVHGSSGGGGERQDENPSAAGGRGKKAGRDSEESGPHLLTASAPRVPVSSIKLDFNVNGVKSKFLRKINLFANMFVFNRHSTFFFSLFQAVIREASFFLSWPSQKAKSCLLACSPSLNTTRQWQSWESWLQICPHWWAETQRR